MNQKSKDGSSRVTDESFNTASHMVGAVFALLGSVFLIVDAALAEKMWHLVSFSIYGLFLFLLFLASALHHGIQAGPKAQHVLRQLDYLAIFPLIAGTYTPICLVVLRGPVGWSVFGVIWALAVFGIALKASIAGLPKWFTSTLYLAMGLMSLVMIVPLFRTLPLGALLLLVLGGAFYVSGNVIFSLEKPNPVPGKFGFHEIWHLFVLAGALSHYLMMYVYVRNA
jgi:hemolysin III